VFVVIGGAALRERLDEAARSSVFFKILRKGVAAATVSDGINEIASKPHFERIFAGKI
jgi:hypothetical protein